MFHVLCLIFLLSSPLFAGVDSKLVAKAEIYLNGITGLSGEFSQAAGGKRDKGVFSMLRPGRVRLDYSTLPVQLVSNGKDLYFYDKSLDQITTVPLTSTPAGILVRKKINLTTADIVVSETMSTPNSFSLNIHIRGQEGAGRMRVDFSQNPVALKSWVVYDATGMETEIVFVDMKIKTDFPKNYFELQRHKMTSNSGGDDFYE
ncbi:MAG: outer membrane lipoprotein carrier protein LolA [Rickettsiales bacterium]|jgi:outer membrane lipoprotein-sorting protein|nr:outer membrane lipoprotein carrier protein LolA [Rickettsiales bacterium]